ncbi:MAG: chloride channel protein [Sulfuricella sp.]|nr:chloride channel protein [Sulfuricella sp.]
MDTTQDWKKRIVFWAGAVCVGLAAFVFAIGSEYVNVLYHRITNFSPLFPLLLAPAGFALVVAITHKFFPGSQGSGIPQTIAALELQDMSLRDKLLSLRIASGKILLTLLGLLSGASTGREGPTVQIGASIMHTLGRWAHFPSHDLERGLILAGGAAGVAAAFNTPLAGIVFAIEELSRSFEQRTSGTILIAVMIAGVTSLSLQGNYTYFGTIHSTINFGVEWAAVFVCGIAGGLFGGVFSRTLIAGSRGLPGRLGVFMRERPVLFAAGCGFILALLGLLSGSTVYGTGYHEARQILEGSGAMPESFGILKMAATVVSYLSGIPGGIFSPSLAIGAGMGLNLSHVLPFAPAGAVILLGMVGFFAGVIQAPITAFIIVMEMTDNHAMVLPLMATSFIAMVISRLICRDSLYQALAQNFIKRFN